MIGRRIFLLSSIAVAVTAAYRGFISESVAASPVETFAVTKTDAEWKAMLTDDQYQILRHANTERPFLSALNHEKRKGTFHCAGCNQSVYSSETKFDSGTGWPSFWDAIPKAVGTREDTSMFMVRTECAIASTGWR